MAPHALPFHPRRPHLVRPVPIDPTGQLGPTRGQARGPGYRRTSHGLYVPAHVRGDLVEQRIVEALPASPDALITGWAALRWLGGSWFHGLTAAGDPLPVPVTGAKTVRRRASVALTKESWLQPAHRAEVDGLPITTAVRSVHFAMRYATSLVAAVIVLDMAAYDDLVTVEEVRAFTGSAGPRTGVALARQACALASESSWSPMETWLRLVWVLDAGFPPPLCNQPVFDPSGRLIGTPDLLDHEAGVAVEYDGPVHLDARQRRRDRDREEAFRSHGLEHVAVMAGDGRSEATVRRLREARRRARWEPAATRAWTITAPPWWTSTTSVESRRALSDADRARLLTYRRAG